MAKFKKDEVIQVGDKNDPGHKAKHYYKIVDDLVPYTIKSLTRGTVYTPDMLNEAFIDIKAKLNLPYNTVQEWIEADYMLVTKQEMILHGREEVQENL